MKARTSSLRKNNSLLLLLRDFSGQYPLRFIMVILGLLVAGMAEGIGIATFLPVIQLITDSSPTDDSPLARMTVDLLGAFGLKPTLGYLLLFVVMAILLKSLILFVSLLQTGYVTMRIITDLRMQLVRELLTARWAFFIEKSVGSFANAINSESVRSSQAFFASFLFVGDVLQLSVYAVMALLISWKITILAIFSSIIFFWAFNYLLGMARSAGWQQTQLERSVLSRVTDTLQGIKPIKAMGIQSRIWPIIEKDLDALLAALKRQTLATQILKAQHEILVVLLICVALYLLVEYGNVQTTVLIGLAILFYKTVSQFAALQKRYQLVETHQSAYRALKEMISEATAAAENPRGGVPPTLVGPIVFNNVTMTHGNRRIISDVTIELPLTGLVCFSGASGAGKTSLVDMIAGLNVPQQGEISVGDVNLNDLDINAWRKNIGYVPQEMTLFNDSLANNITLGDKNFTEEHINASIEKAGLMEVVRELPEGLETQLGERGAKLSGGQRQRLAIARAIIRKPAVLILDEVTTSLDPQTEQEICETLLELSKASLVIAISHQPALQQLAARVIEINRGKVVRDVAHNH